MLSGRRHQQTMVIWIVVVLIVPILQFLIFSRFINFESEFGPNQFTNQFFSSYNNDTVVVVTNSWENIGLIHSNHGSKQQIRSNVGNKTTIKVSSTIIATTTDIASNDNKAIVVHNNRNSTTNSFLGGQKVMLYVTTHMSELHKWYLRVCWPKALQKSKLLRSTHVVVHLNCPNGTQRQQAIEILQTTFRSNITVQSLTIHFYDPIIEGHQVGAMKALSDAVREGWWSGYDWVIRLNPDVIIRDDRFVLKTIAKKNTNNIDTDIKALLISCPFKTTKIKLQAKRLFDLDFQVHTDFFVIQPDALPKDAFLEKPSIKNAEIMFTKQIYSSILIPKRYRFIPNAAPIGYRCRAGAEKAFKDTPITHVHSGKGIGSISKLQQCPIPF